MGMLQTQETVFARVLRRQEETFKESNEASLFDRKKGRKRSVRMGLVAGHLDSKDACIHKVISTGLSTVTLGTQFLFIFTQIKRNGTGLSDELSFLLPSISITLNLLTANLLPFFSPLEIIIEELVQRLPGLCSNIVLNIGIKDARSRKNGQDQGACGECGDRILPFQLRQLRGAQEISLDDRRENLLRNVQICVKDESIILDFSKINKNYNPEEVEK